MNKVIIGYDKEQIVKAAVLAGFGVTEDDLAKDTLDMLRSGLTISVVDANKITVGEVIDWSEVNETKL